MMDKRQINLAQNLTYLRKANHLTLEGAAEKVNVSRQAIAKWESGASSPDILNCVALAKLYDVSLDDLLFNDGSKATGLGPRGKHYFGTVTVKEGGTVKLPPAACQMYNFTEETKLALLGNEIGLALVPKEGFMTPLQDLMKKYYPHQNY